jgi:hypothetical protein
MTTAPRALRPMGSLLALAILSVLTMLSVSRCKYGPDKVTGVDSSKPRSGASQCVHDCTEAFEDSVKAENKLHKNNLDECRDGSGHHGKGGGEGDDDDDLIAIDPAAALHDGDGDGDHHGDDHHKDSPCIQAENARHKAALQRIARGLQDCLSTCHHQGGGSGN